MFDIRYWRCVYKKSDQCPDRDINFYLYTPEHRYRKKIDVRNPYSLTYSGWDPDRKNVIIIHGFNGTEGKTPMSFIRDAYLKTGDYNVLTVDWGSLTHFPCYLSSISNTRLVAQCTAQLYSFLTASGATAESTTCIGHSLGAHICGMMNNHLTDRMHKIVGLDPARPLVDRYGDEAFRLTKDDANVVQIIHTNAGALGETSQVGTIDFCVNGGRFQPSCKGHRLRRARCSHFLSPNINIGRLPGHSVVMGEHTPDHAKGHYCVAIKHDAPCPFD
ncbi:UNVERIFIED_CONTAM: hypothetical protein PYX00_009485 [Menopon gallinae]|uniref:Lipase domain-containing protein n=1 Tax=Menopon gallinae TaxID=328185 RepID=A0AAW2HC59_9NEOP